MYQDARGTMCVAFLDNARFYVSSTLPHDRHSLLVPLVLLTAYSPTSIIPYIEVCA